MYPSEQPSEDLGGMVGSGVSPHKDAFHCYTRQIWVLVGFPKKAEVTFP